MIWPAPVQIEFASRTTDNVTGGWADPFKVLPPRSRIRLATLAPRDASKAYALHPSCAMP
jgi:hypothetical protein